MDSRYLGTDFRDLDRSGRVLRTRLLALVERRERQASKAVKVSAFFKSDGVSHGSLRLRETAPVNPLSRESKLNTNAPMGSEKMCALLAIGYHLAVRPPTSLLS